MGHSLSEQLRTLPAHFACGRRACEYRRRPPNARRIRKRSHVPRADKFAVARRPSAMGPPLDGLRGGAISIPILAPRITHRDNGAAQLSVAGRQSLVEPRWATETPIPPARGAFRDHEPSARPYSKGAAGGKRNGETAKRDRPGIPQGPHDRC